MPDPRPTEVVIFEEQLECELWLHCSNFLITVLHLFEVEIQHISPNSFVHLSVFDWAFRSAGFAIVSARAFTHLHTTRNTDEQGGPPRRLTGGAIRHDLLRASG